MKNKVLSRWHLNKNLFVHVLANHKSSKKSKIWAYYRLGMYESVLKEKTSSLDWKIIFAKLISNAALGKDLEVEKWLKILQSCKTCPPHISILVSGLLPFMPKRAYELGKSKNGLSTLNIALLIELGLYDEAKNRAENTMKVKKYRNSPELLLYTSNLNKRFPPLKKLTLLNKFLLQYNLTKLRLKDRTKTPSVSNFKPGLASKVTKGKLVSIIMTTYNSASTVETALDSILAQSHLDLEIIVVDDCSQDDTVEIVEKYVNIDKRIRIIKLQKNVGTYVAKNQALKIASGEFVTCHDSDDYSHRLKIERQIEPLLKDKKLVASISDWVRIDENGTYYARYIHPLSRMNLSSFLYRREEVIQKVGFYDSVRTGADSEFFARVGLAFGKKAVKRLKQPLSFGAHRENSLMTATDTGYSGSGISLDRLAYWESWNHWHIEEIKLRKIPYIAVDVKDKRVFSAPTAITITEKEVEKIEF